MINRYLIILALTSSVTLVACSSLQNAFSFLPGVRNPDETRIRSLDVCALANANLDSSGLPSATEVDVLFILDEEITALLPKTAGQWFDERERLLANHRNDIVAVPMALPPGLSVRRGIPKSGHKARDVIAYANYFSSEGQAWLRLPDEKEVSIELAAQTWSFAEQCK